MKKIIAILIIQLFCCVSSGSDMVWALAPQSLMKDPKFKTQAAKKSWWKFWQSQKSENQNLSTPQPAPNPQQSQQQNSATPQQEQTTAKKKINHKVVFFVALAVVTLTLGVVGAAAGFLPGAAVAVLVGVGLVVSIGLAIYGMMYVKKMVEEHLSRAKSLMLFGFIAVASFSLMGVTIAGLILVPGVAIVFGLLGLLALVSLVKVYRYKVSKEDPEKQENMPTEDAATIQNRKEAADAQKKIQDHKAEWNSVMAEYASSISAAKDQPNLANRIETINVTHKLTGILAEMKTDANAAKTAWAKISSLNAEDKASLKIVDDILSQVQQRETDLSANAKRVVAYKTQNEVESLKTNFDSAWSQKYVKISELMAKARSAADQDKQKEWQAVLEGLNSLTAEIDRVPSAYDKAKTSWDAVTDATNGENTLITANEKMRTLIFKQKTELESNLTEAKDAMAAIQQKAELEKQQEENDKTSPSDGKLQDGDKKSDLPHVQSVPRVIRHVKNSKRKSLSRQDFDSKKKAVEDLDPDSDASFEEDAVQSRAPRRFVGVAGQDLDALDSGNEQGDDEYGEELVRPSLRPGKPFFGSKGQGFYRQPEFLEREFPQADLYDAGVSASGDLKQLLAENARLKKDISALEQEIALLERRAQDEARAGENSKKAKRKAHAVVAKRKTQQPRRLVTDELSVASLSKRDSAQRTQQWAAQQLRDREILRSQQQPQRQADLEGQASLVRQQQEQQLQLQQQAERVEMLRKKDEAQRLEERRQQEERLMREAQTRQKAKEEGSIVANIQLGASDAELQEQARLRRLKKQSQQGAIKSTKPLLPAKETTLADLVARQPEEDLLTTLSPAKPGKQGLLFKMDDVRVAQDMLMPTLTKYGLTAADLPASVQYEVVEATAAGNVPLLQNNGQVQGFVIKQAANVNELSGEVQEVFHMNEYVQPALKALFTRQYGATKSSEEIRLMVELASMFVVSQAVITKKGLDFWNRVVREMNVYFELRLQGAEQMFQLQDLLDILGKQHAALASINLQTGGDIFAQFAQQLPPTLQGDKNPFTPDSIRLLSQNA